MVVADPASIVTTSVLPNETGEIVDTRTLEEGRMHVLLALSLPDGRVIRTKRVFDKVQDVSEDDDDALMELLDE